MWVRWIKAGSSLRGGLPDVGLITPIPWEDVLLFRGAFYNNS
jgi:hypothetical protein